MPADPAQERPTPGDLLATLAPWPREWAQRLGRSASDLGGRAEVHSTSASAGAWELRWVVGRRPVLTMRPQGEGVEVDLWVQDSSRRHVLEDPRTDDGVRAALLEAPSARGRRRLRLPLNSARRVASLELVLKLEMPA